MDKLYEKINAILKDPTQINVCRMGIMDGQADLTDYSELLNVRAKEFLEDYMEKHSQEECDISKCVAMIILSEIYYQNDDCYHALIMINSALAFLEKEDNDEIWVAARYVQMCILLVTGQLHSIYPMVDGMKERIHQSENQELIKNYEAMRAWSALYDDDWHIIEEWMNTSAPNEFDKLKLKDTYRLFIKARVYYMQDQYLAAISLLQSMEGMLTQNNRTMELCELNMLLAMAFDAQGHTKEAYEYFEKSLDIAESRGLSRLIADEGEPIFRLIRGYYRNINKESKNSRFIQGIKKISRDMALLYPRYLKNHRHDYPRLTKKEIMIIKLLAVGMSNAEIAEFLENSQNTVKCHIKNIFQKLGASNRTQAIKIAQEERLVK